MGCMSSCTACVTYAQTATGHELDAVVRKAPIIRESNLPYRPPAGFYEELRSKLQNHVVIDDPLVAWRQGSAAEMADVVYKGSKIDGLWERCPEHLRGVFWMNGNAVPEVLVALQRSVWFKEERVLVTPFSPFMWAWPTGIPPSAPMLGGGYRFYGSGDVAAGGLRYGQMAISFQFSTDDLDFATMRYHPHGDLTRSTEVVVHTAKQIANTLEMDPKESRKGAKWTRRIQWSGPSCQFGSYTLKKVLDQHGKPVEPYYSEFLQYMGELPVFVWAGSVAGPPIPLEPANQA